MATKPLGPVPGLGFAKLASTHSVIRMTDGTVTSEATPVAEEVPVAMIYNGEPFVVMMASPADLEDLAFGFSITEGIVERASELRVIDLVRHSRGIEIQMAIPDTAAARIAERRRGISARTGCGVCGIESIDEVLRAPAKVASEATFDAGALWRAAAELESRQPLNAETRAVHAAAIAAGGGHLETVREDVGRHNAVDKAIGAMLRAAQNPGERFLVVTSRASYELVQKAATAGVPMLAAVSRPTSLAIHLAEQSFVTLVGLLRGRSANVYTHPARLGHNSSIR
jgi:FdhD protein